MFRPRSQRNEPLWKKHSATPKSWKKDCPSDSAWVLIEGQTKQVLSQYRCQCLDWRVHKHKYNNRAWSQRLARQNNMLPCVWLETLKFRKQCTANNRLQVLKVYWGPTWAQRPWLRANNIVFLTFLSLKQPGLRMVAPIWTNIPRNNSNIRWARKVPNIRLGKQNMEHTSWKLLKLHPSWRMQLRTSPSKNVLELSWTLKEATTTTSSLLWIAVRADVTVW